ncbi:phosphate/phosphite/phosphonate ABC transporter, periplasmic binding protein [Desulfocurvibacter africanus PCS]|uniref:Phosphate/phosphite/phosphonate ABC transporter, periplasmic binding protein n=1 Tax=Desulfocurvibacter africanus PCS TaxID=1262666 RepID=M5PSH9_DESAF|nr:phosphate/phosphite/phosphonate ABC transporter substrate-binding protein [Desulfocurvibacter africanus]EMG36990.1 phosphate/phosphite/phosphonate ABC transporter, periplasmic binding protein [Desulfocurvibacter africanus PCS]
MHKNRVPDWTSRMVFALAVALVAILVACSEEESVVRVDFSKREEVTIPKPREDLTYAYLPQYSPAVSYLRHHRMVEYLAKATGLSIRQVFPSSFEEHMSLFGQGRIDISYTNPFVYIKIADRYGAKAFARIVEPSGNDTFSGQVITRADNTDIETLEDCRGKRWIATDESSAGGYLFPLGLFWDHDIRKVDFAEVNFAGGNQERVVYAVYSGEYDIGTIRTGTLDITRNRIPIREIRVVAESPAYPSWAYATRGGMDQRTVEKIRAAMTALASDNPEHRAILAPAGIMRIVPAQDRDFDPVRALMAKISGELEE